ncbi:hypothetical protein NPIL_415741 [Nephila pilipes]|uniref:Uncharacterized protein n=1 Tax=Nephila pilipes TaxID=299642 RepID=A0A8X6P127_NEPPI|nr:hypothetical protein NPIL_415741 [Nephila pilipes]
MSFLAKGTKQDLINPTEELGVNVESTLRTTYTVYHDYVPQTQQKPCYQDKRKPYHLQGQIRSQPHKYESFGQNKNQGAREISGLTSHFGDCVHDNLFDQNNKHIETFELKEDKEQL